MPSNYAYDCELATSVPANYHFLSVNYRLMKLFPDAKDHAPMSVTYKGGMKGSEDTFKLDYKNSFKVPHKSSCNVLFVLGLYWAYA